MIGTPNGAPENRGDVWFFVYFRTVCGCLYG